MMLRFPPTSGAVVMEGQEGEMSVVTHVDAEQFQVKYIDQYIW